MTTADKE
jgi:hypothetical protein